MNPLVSIAILAGVLVVSIALVFRPKPKPSSPTRTPGVLVDEAHAKQTPYPYVMVNKDGSVRELHASERTPLEMHFSPFDGGRPSTKTTYEDRTRFGDQSGYLLRSKVPTRMRIQPAPTTPD